MLTDTKYEPVTSAPDSYYPPFTAEYSSEFVDYELRARFKTGIQHLQIEQAVECDPSLIAYDTQTALRKKFTEPKRGINIEEKFEQDIQSARGVALMKGLLPGQRIFTYKTPEKILETLAAGNIFKKSIVKLFPKQRLEVTKDNMAELTELNIDALATLQEWREEFNISNPDQHLLSNWISRQSLEKLIDTRSRIVFMRLHPGARALINDRINSLTPAGGQSGNHP